MDSQLITKQITVYDLDVFTAKLRELNKKAAKVGVSPVTYVVQEEVTKKVAYRWAGQEWFDSDGESKTYEVTSHYVVDIAFEQVVFAGGWQLVGVIDHVENLVKNVPVAGQDVEPLQEWLARGPVCDHCHVDRSRNETFVLRGEKGSLVQIGRTCLHLFLGISAERALAGAGYVSETAEFGDEEYTGKSRFLGYELGHFLANAAALIRTTGWRSRSAVRENGFDGGRATADSAWENIADSREKRKDRYGNPLWVDVTEEDGRLAERVVEWLVELGKRNGLSDYLSNLAQIGVNGFVTTKSSGFAASAIVAYGKEQEEQVKRSSGGVGKSTYVGTVGSKVVGLAVKLVKTSGFDTEYGYTFIHRFVGQHGDIFVWRTKTELDLGDYVVDATVKEHAEYRGELQTVITRAKTVKLEVA